MVTVVAALIEHDGKLLVCQRRRGDRFELLWEFPGGKLEPGETPEQALQRELREELGVTATIGREVYRTQHQYAQMKEPLELIFMLAQLDPLAVQNLAFEQMQWREPASLLELNFLPADRELIEKLANGTLVYQ
ncbi:MAG: (deoxy)nucleoside triphosphate pyrophosphohydrolase [Candidatus Acidiferrales bacterium]